jgi:hypothetical protein
LDVSLQIFITNQPCQASICCVEALFNAEVDRVHNIICVN